MGKLFLAIGISGSGKSFTGKLMKKIDNELAIVCPDDIRKEVNGDISDQSNANVVWSTTNNLITKYMAAGKNVYLSATNLNSDNIRKYLALYSLNDVIGIIMNDSNDPELCRTRVIKDLADGIDRSNTINIINTATKEDVIDMQYKKFMNLMSTDLIKKPADYDFKICIVDNAYPKANEIMLGNLLNFS